jgi:ABC-type amino acid transport system permease subunit
MPEIIKFLLYLIKLAVTGIWLLLGTTIYGYWFVPVVGAIIGWLRSKDWASIKALRNAFVDALASVVIVFIIVFMWELCWKVPRTIWQTANAIPEPLFDF